VVSIYVLFLFTFLHSKREETNFERNGRNDYQSDLNLRTNQILISYLYSYCQMSAETRDFLASR
jgi:hypothetical protein